MREGWRKEKGGEIVREGQWNPNQSKIMKAFEIQDLFEES